MPLRLPPLTALRAFDTAARHMSFAKAAEELNVTPAALSFQVKSLEEHLGTPLFNRLNRAVELTEAGRALAPGCKDGFETLSAAWRSAHRTLDGNALTVTAGPAFTAKWLAPRLYDFAQSHPEIELRFSASLRLVDLERDGVDVAIRFGRVGTDDSEYFSLPLAEEWVCPVMTPQLAAKVKEPRDLLDMVLVEDESLGFLAPAPDWSAWFASQGISLESHGGPRFSQADHALDAAHSGIGPVLGRRSLVMRELAEGRLVAPFPTALGTGGQFRILCSKGTESRPHIQAFIDWIQTELERTNSGAGEITIISARSE